MNVLIGAALAVLMGALWTPTLAQTADCAQSPDPSQCAAVVDDIKATAERHFRLGAAQSSAVKQEFTERGAGVGLDVSAVGRIYEEEYLRLQTANQPSIWEQFKPNIGWVAAGILGLWAIFRDTISQRAAAAVAALDNAVYSRFAGSKLFRQQALKRYRHALIDKHKELKIPFRPNRPLSMQDIYVPLKVAGTSDTEQIDAYRTLLDFRRLMVTGPPGSGKSMLMRHLALRHGEDKLTLPDNPVVILLELHRVAKSDKSLVDQLVDALARDDFPHGERFVAQGLEAGTVMLLLDGLDEVNGADRPQVVAAIKDLMDRYARCRVVVTCRTQVYQNELAAEVDRTLEIVDFNDQQMRQFLRAWQVDMPRDKSVDQLMQTLRDRPRVMALARNPLMLTIVAYLYTDTQFVLPHSRAEFYQKSTDILLDQWHQEHNQFPARDKKLILRHLALYNQDSTQQWGQDRRSMVFQTVLEQIQQVLPGLNLPPADAQPILAEIVERSGLLELSKEGEYYRFAHQTLQEYFAAAALLENEAGLIERFNQDWSAWQETAKLWCGLAGDSTRLIQAMHNRNAIIAFECLADAQRVDTALAEDIIDRFQQLYHDGQSSEGIERAFGAVAADSRPRGRAVFDFLVSCLEQGSGRVQAAAANALSYTNLLRAAQVLGQHYGNADSRSALVRMGDLAIPTLSHIAQTQATNAPQKLAQNALDDLAVIATPDAAKALTEFLWHSETALVERAAWHLAALLQSLSIEEALREYSLTPEQRQADTIDWLWQPFNEPSTSAIPVIAGRIAYLLSQARDLQSLPPKKLDPRTIIPICLVLNIDQMTWPSKATSQESPEQFIENWFEEEYIDASWQVLFDTLPKHVQLEAVRQLMLKNQRPERQDWLNVFRPLTYEFGTSYHYRIVLIVSIVGTILALLEIVFLMEKNPNNHLAWLTAIPFFPILFFWDVLKNHTEQSWKTSLFLEFGFLGVGTFVKRLKNLLKQREKWDKISIFYKASLDMTGSKHPDVNSFLFIFDNAFLGAALLTFVILVLPSIINETGYSSFFENFFTSFFRFFMTVVGFASPVSLFACAGSFAVSVADVFPFAFILAITLAISGALLGTLTVAFLVAFLVSAVLITPVTPVIVTPVIDLSTFPTNFSISFPTVLIAFSWALAGAGVGFWVRAASKIDVGRFLAVLAFPFFCTAPIVATFSTLFLHRFLPWPQAIATWVIVLSLCTLLWQVGQRKDRATRNPLHGLLDPPQGPIPAP